ncbi:anthranilate synthase component I family protein [Bacillus mojavensis]|uniref:anthranilate synthase component I family protein n=1 Tax=Bacillus mojavensis TaxID=72360 RepID=UPI002DB8B4AA|nr:anthranilate synthase component I family protein [Bacillus mojavensis]MEC1614780.1 anthranilate synthase component I family protein [Bacillus mojavensis]MEC1690654.1 anthranilate synthase component I family protein [Bacillus mojavensis]
MIQTEAINWRINEYTVSEVLTIDILRKQLLTLYPNSSLFETSSGFQEVDGADTTFMVDLLFEITLVDGTWKIESKEFFNIYNEPVNVILNREGSSIWERFREITKLLNLPDSFPIVFMLSYSAARFVEDISNMKIDHSEPEVVFRVYKNVVSVDKERILATVKSLSCNDRIIDKRKELTSFIKENYIHKSKVNWDKGEIIDVTDKEKFLQAVNHAKQYIKDGEIYQVQLCRTTFSSADIPPLELYERLSLVNPSPYMYYIELNKQHVISSSPELMIRIKDNVAQVRPIAGTMSKNDIRDTPLNEIPKESAEHLMLVDLARNDLARCALSGGLKVTNLMKLEPYGDIDHLVSTVETRIKEGIDIWDLISSNFPAGTMTGAPKVRAMEIIAELEDTPRGLYSGCGGYFTSKGEGIFALTIRTIIGNPGNYKLCSAAGIVADSEPSAEWDEAGIKTKSFAKAIDPKSKL